MQIVEAIGFLAATCTTVSFVPQALQVIRKKQTQDISLSMYIIFALGILFWLIYGLMGHLPAVISANSITLVLVLIILGMKLKYG